MKYRIIAFNKYHLHTTRLTEFLGYEQTLTHILGKGKTPDQNGHMRHFMHDLAIHGLRMLRHGAIKPNDGKTPVSIFDPPHSDDADGYLRVNSRFTENQVLPLLLEDDINTKKVDPQKVVLVDHANFRDIAQSYYQTFNVSSLPDFQKSFLEHLETMRQEIFDQGQLPKKPHQMEQHISGLIQDRMKRQFLLFDLTELSQKAFSQRSKSQIAAISESYDLFMKTLQDTFKQYNQSHHLSGKEQLGISFDVNAINLHDIKGQPAVFLHGKDEAVARFRKNLITIRGQTGYTPDFTRIWEPVLETKNQSLAETIRSLNVDHHPEPSTVPKSENLRIVSRTDLNEQMKTLQKRLSRLDITDASESDGSKILVEILESLINGMINEIQNASFTIEYFQTIVSERLQVISKTLDLFEQSLADEVRAKLYFDLIYEEMALILAALAPGDTNEHTGHAAEQTISKIQQMSIKNLPESLRAEHLTTHLLSSGMRAYSHILNALQAQAGSKPLSITYFSDIYYEGQILLAKMSNSSSQVTTTEIPHEHFADNSTSIEDHGLLYNPLKNSDVLCIDIHPNNPRLTSTVKHSVSRLIELAEAYGRKKPLTVVVDTTMHHFQDHEVQALLEEHQEAIAAGKLNLVITQSLAKFTTFGTDRFSAGITQTYNANEVFSKFNTQLTHLTETDAIPDYPARALGVLAEYAWPHFDSYLNMIRFNALYLEDELADAFEKSDIFLLGSLHNDNTDSAGIYSDPTYVAIHYQPKITQAIKDFGANEAFNLNQFNKLILNYLNILAQQEGLDLNLRYSFGFANTNVGDCHGSIRLTPGLESEAKLQKYIQLLKDVELEISKLLLQGEDVSLKQIEDIINGPAIQVRRDHLSRPQISFLEDITHRSFAKSRLSFDDFLKFHRALKSGLPN